MKAALAAFIGAFAGAAGAITLPAFVGPVWALASGAQLLLIAGGVRIDMPRLAAAAAVGSWPLLLGAAAHIAVR